MVWVSRSHNPKVYIIIFKQFILKKFNKLSTFSLLSHSYLTPVTSNMSYLYLTLSYHTLKTFYDPMLSYFLLKLDENEKLSNQDRGKPRDF